jgi:hypothetical protein
MSKQINFTNNDYTNLLQALGPHTAASTPVTINLNDTEVVARLVVHSKDAPKNPLIEFDYQNEHEIWFKITDQNTGNTNQVFIELPEGNLNKINSSPIKNNSKSPDNISINEVDISDVPLITFEDYANVFNQSDGGFGASTGKTFNFIKGNLIYKWCFTLPGYIPANNMNIKFVLKEDNVLNYHVVDVNDICQSSFSIKPINNEENLNYISRNEELRKTILNLPKTEYRSLNYKEKIAYYNVNKLKVTFKFNDLLLTSQTSGDESSHLGNMVDLKNKAKTYFENGKIYFNDTKNVASCENFIYAVDKKGILYTYSSSNAEGATHHSYFLKGTPNKGLYGYGKPISSAGSIKIHDGKIVEIDNSSGHYLPDLKQTLLVAKLFKEKDVLSDNCIIKDHTNINAHYTIKDLDNINSLDILGNYNDLDNIDL